MNREIMKGQWKELKGKVKQKWGEFTNDELDQLDGTYEQMEGALQKKYGYSKEKADKALDDFLDEIH